MTSILWCLLGDVAALAVGFVFARCVYLKEPEEEKDEGPELCNLRAEKKQADEWDCSRCGAKYKRMWDQQDKCDAVRVEKPKRHAPCNPAPEEKP